MKVLIMSDIHGNITALEALLKRLKKQDDIEACILLGDLIDYGQHSNEVIQRIQKLDLQILCNIRGNHEQAIINEDYSRFSSERGKICARHTREFLDDNTWSYITDIMNQTGICEFRIQDKLCLAIHGSIQDEYWKSISPSDSLEGYESYDYVFSGHSHIPHYMEHYSKVDNPAYRNKKKTIFLNPGSVGQPRNHNPHAQCVILDTVTEEVQFVKVNYDIKQEQKAFDDTVDVFYKTRLEVGI